MSERPSFGKELTGRYPGHFEDSQKPTVAELSSLPPLTNLQPYPYPYPVESDSGISSRTARHLAPEESADLLRRGNEFLNATSTEK